MSFVSFILDRLPQAVDREHFIGWNGPPAATWPRPVFRRDQAARVEFGLLTTGMLTQAFVLRSMTCVGLRRAIRRTFSGVRCLPHRAHAAISWFRSLEAGCECPANKPHLCRLKFPRG